MESENVSHKIVIIKPPKCDISGETPALPDVSCHPSDSYGQFEFINCPKPTIYFMDGIRSVDFVLVWDVLEVKALTDDAYQRRNTFEANLVNEGLELEYEPQEKNGLNFVKVNK